MLRALFAIIALAASAPTVHAEDEGDLNPQPLPPIAEDGVIIAE